MSFLAGEKIKVTTLDDQTFEGTLYQICLGMDDERRNEASIIISEEKKEKMVYGQVHLFCSDIKNIVRI